MDDNYYRDQIRRLGLSKPDAYNPYAAGPKLYGYGRTNPTSGQVSTDGMQGYRDRDRLARLRRQDTLAKVRAGQQNRFLSPQWLGAN